MSFFFVFRSSMAFVFSIYVRKYRKFTIDRWIVCASTVIPPLRQWLDSCAKTHLKMCHTFKHFIYMQYFCCWIIMLSSLYIELALVCCTNPDSVHCFGTIFPNLNFVFASICAARPVHIQFGQYISCSIVKQRRNSSRWEQSKSALELWSLEMTWYLYIRGVRGRMKGKQRWFKVTREVCHAWFHHVRHYKCSWRPLDWIIRHSHFTSTLLHSLVPWWRPRIIRPQRTRLSQLNSAMDTWPIYKNYYTRLVRKMAWYKILIHVLIV